MGKTFAEKVLSRAAGYPVKAGDIVTVYPDFCLSHENTSSICTTFRTIGVEKVYDPDRIVIVFDHTVPPPPAGTPTASRSRGSLPASRGSEIFTT